jgi:hypothetical protein
MRKPLVLVALACAPAVAGIGWSGAEKALAAESKPLAFDLDRIAARNATATPGKDAIRVEIKGGQEGWAGVELPAVGGPLDISRYRFIAAQVRNLGNSPVRIEIRVNNSGASADAKGTCAFAALDVQPSQTWEWTMAPIARSPDTVKVNLFGMIELPWRLAGQNDLADPSRATAFVVSTPDPKEDHLFEVRNIRGVGSGAPVELTRDPAAFFPIVDEFGQYAHGEWPGKTHSMNDLAVERAAEAADLAAKPGPADWDQYGGWKGGPQLEATGFFRAAKHDGAWWLVDPEGRLFFSIGVCCVNWTNPTVTEEREQWFKDLPALELQFRDCTGMSNPAGGHYRGRRVRHFDHAQANIIRKYGENWRDAYYALAHRRLRSWGMNTIANWSADEIAYQQKTPYTRAIWLRSLKTLPNGFYDVFDPGFRPTVAGQVKHVAGKSIGDPWCIGFYVDNELPWGRDDTSLAMSALCAPANQPAKVAFVTDLKSKYESIEKLNAAWGTSHASWEALLSATAEPDAATARADLAVFQQRICDAYFETVRDALKAVAPNQLYLGCRFYRYNVPTLAAAVKYCDVISFNLYRRSLSDFRLPGDADVPMISGEFSFAAADVGMMGGFGLLVDQASRAEAYIHYLRGALRHPQFVGCHWFQYRDEPTTARSYDEENYQWGFVDVADTPYAEMIRAAREIAKTMYKTRADTK